MIHAQPNLYSPFRLSEIGSTFKVCLLLGLIAFSSAWADESGRWIPVKSQSKERFYYDSKSLKPDALGFEVWLKDLNLELKGFSFDCKNRLVDSTPITPESIAETVFDPKIRLKPIQKLKETSGTPDLSVYMAELHRRIRRNWKPNPKYRDTVVKVSFNISKDGQVSNIQFQNPLLPDAILAPAYSAIMNSAPFPKLPTGYPSNSVKVDFTFNYQIYGH